MSPDQTALVLGATGLVGHALTTFLLHESAIVSVTAVVRNATNLPPHEKLRVLTTDFDSLDQHAEAFRVSHVFCALGTTMRRAGSREQFYRVDHDYPLAAARLAHSHGASHFLLVSAMGADARSRVYYNRVKGETERDIAAVGFKCYTIARPSLLTGSRDEFRLGERLGQLVGWLLPAAIGPIPAIDVAAALTLASRDPRPGTRTLTSRAMRGASMQLSKA